MPGIVGSNKLVTFIGDALAGRSGVDIVHLGDSNTGHTASGSSHNGWIDALHYAFNQFTPNCIYATPMYSMGLLSSPNYGYEMNAAYGGLIGNTDGGLTSYQDYSGPGYDAAPVYPILQCLVSPLKVGNTNTGSCIWRTGDTATRYASFITGIYINQTTTGMDVNGTFIYRCVGGLFDDPGSEMKVIVKSSSTVFNSAQTISFYEAGSKGSIGHKSTTFPPTARNANLHFGTAGAGVGTSNGWKAPFAFGWNSVVQPKNGIASSVLSHHGSATLKGILDNVIATTDVYLQTYFKEIILRQKQATGLNYARCVVWINAGQNGNAASVENKWSTYVPPSGAKMKAAWIAAGGRAEDLVFCLMTSHTIMAGDTDRDSLRVDANALALTSTDLNITAINPFEVITYEVLNAGGALGYENSNPTSGHLTDYGYRISSAQIVTQITEDYNMANTSSSANPLTTVPVFAPDFRGESEGLYQTATLAASGTVVLPKIETFPATFFISQPAATVANCRHGHVTALSSSLVVASGTNVSTTAGVQTIVPSISAGVITLTANATFENASAGAAVVSVTRVG